MLQTSTPEGREMKKIAVSTMAGLSALSLVAIAEAASSAQATNDPKKSKVCKVHEPFARAGGVVVAPTTITMNNDGKSCWYIRHSTQSGRVFGVPMHVTSQPSHGAVEIVVLDKGTRIAYKPTTGFIGTDEFSVINEMYNVERPYKVTVSK
jgi:hypothetical protein